MEQTQERKRPRSRAAMRLREVCAKISRVFGQIARWFAHRGSRGWAAVRTWLLMPWVKGIAVLMAGAALGWVGGRTALNKLRVEAAIVSPKAVPSGKVLQAVVSGALPKADVAPGEQVELSWYVTNTGDVTWSVDLFRFVPDDPDLPIITLPRTVNPGSSVMVRTHVTVQTVGPVRLTWTLQKGNEPVPGSNLEATISVRTTLKGSRSGDASGADS